MMTIMRLGWSSHCSIGFLRSSRSSVGFLRRPSALNFPLAMAKHQEPDPDLLLQPPPPPPLPWEPPDLITQLGDPPEKPLPGDCCGSGCVRCVWDTYYEDLERYNQRKAALESRLNPS